MKLVTGRLVLEPITLRDANDLASIGNDKKISYFTYFIPYPFTVQRAKKND
jgi:RimJ/RimL family protein N-acetyltransferase